MTIFEEIRQRQDERRSFLYSSQFSLCLYLSIYLSELNNVYYTFMIMNYSYPYIRLVGPDRSGRERSHGCGGRPAAGHQVFAEGDRSRRCRLECAQRRARGDHQPGETQRAADEDRGAVAVVHAAPRHVGSAAERPAERRDTGIQRRFHRSQVIIMKRIAHG